MVILITLTVLALAYANGANDNFKGVATLFGSGATHYRGALLWATVTTFLGSVAALALAGTLLKAFSGKGLIDDGLVGQSDYRAAVALGAGLTVWLGTRLGMPISTTHALVGALVGAGWGAGASIAYDRLGASFLMPLLLAPAFAVVITVVVYPVLHRVRQWLGISEQSCLCVGTRTIEILPGTGAAVAQRVEQLALEVGTPVTCRARYAGRVLGIEAVTVLDRLHYLSAGAVSFARGLNDTPKIAGLLLLTPLWGGSVELVLVGTAMALGGLISARRIADTMARRITPMNHGQGLTANLITAGLVLGASPLGLPVSTTHVSCGALFGLGAVLGQARWTMIGKIVLAWITTLPLAMVLGAVCYGVIGLLTMISGTSPIVGS